MISRRQARRQALILLYQWDLSGAEFGSQYSDEIDPWALALAEGVTGSDGPADGDVTRPQGVCCIGI